MKNRINIFKIYLLIFLDLVSFSYTNRKEGFETINKILTLDMKVIKNFCKKYKISLSSLFSSVWSLVVSAYTGKSDILLNKTHSGRDSKKRTNCWVTY